MEEIKIINFLCGKCPFKGCWHNEDGVCINTNKTFLLNTFDYIRDVYEKNIDDIYNESFKCEPKLFDNTCKYCGSQLKYHVDFVPYGENYAKMDLWYCPNCD